MKKVLLIFNCLFILFTITGCSTSNKSKLGELAQVNDQIIKYFQSDNIQYDNYSFNYVDEGRGVVIVGLIDNSKEQQDRFKKIVVDSEYITFIQSNEVDLYDSSTLK